MLRPLATAALALGIAAFLLRSAAPATLAREANHPGAAGAFAAGLPAPDHTVIAIMENHSYSEIIGNPSAPNINSLRESGASFTDSHAVSHPSEPNYLAIFAGTTEGLSDDSCPHSYSSPNLASSLAAAGLTFSGYSESMPHDGYTGCDNGNYARKHNPWVDYTGVSPASNLTFSAFPTDYSLLPTVAIVVPNLCSDMHDCGVGTGDAWLARNMGPYISWAATHNSLFILTFDESNSPTNQITTIFVGPMVSIGDELVRIDHYSILRTVEDLYGVALTGNAAFATSLLGVFPTPTPTATPIARRPPSLVTRTPRPTRVPFRTPLTAS